MSEASPSDLFSQDFLDALPPLPSPGEMQAWDQESARLGIPEAVLMENAARAALAVLKTGVPSLAGKQIALLMGGGSNGGDAACLARQLLDAGANVNAKDLSGETPLFAARSASVIFRFSRYVLTRCPTFDSLAIFYLVHPLLTENRHIFYLFPSQPVKRERSVSKSTGASA